MSVNRKYFAITVVVILLVIAGFMSYRVFLPVVAKPTPVPGFSADQAMQDVITQIDMGPRTPGSAAHTQFIPWVQSEFEKAGWTTEIQNVTVMGHDGQNIIAKRSSTAGKPVIVVGAHGTPVLWQPMTRIRPNAINQSLAQMMEHPVWPLSLV
jgi:hypothetical protein